jgi:protein disulfide-isomerase A1
MKTSLIALVLAAVAAASDVADLKKDTFDSFIKENDLVLAECMSCFHHFQPAPANSI